MVFWGKGERRTVSLNEAIKNRTFKTTSIYFYRRKQIIKKRKIIWLHVNSFEKDKNAESAVFLQ